MSCFYVLVLALLLCTCMTRVSCYSIEDEWYIEVESYALYSLIEKSNFPYHKKESADFVLRQLCSDNGINLEFVDSESAISRLLSKAKRLVPEIKKAARKGGRSGKAAVEKFKKLSYKLILGGASRKAQHLLDAEEKRRKQAEAELKDAKAKLQDAKRNVLLYKRQVKKATITLARLIKRRTGPNA